MCLVLELDSKELSWSFAMLRLRWTYEELKLVTRYVLGLYRKLVNKGLSDTNYVCLIYHGLVFVSICCCPYKYKPLGQAK